MNRVLDSLRAALPVDAVFLRLHGAMYAEGLGPAEAVLVGDSDKDIQAARGAGVAVALYLPERNRAYYDVGHLLAWKPEFVIADFRELLPAVAGR
jgi:phosphoglycolate phosphatase-like HAD superfamily hydrolase